MFMAHSDPEPLFTPWVKSTHLLLSSSGGVDTARGCDSCSGRLSLAPANRPCHITPPRFSQQPHHRESLLPSSRLASGDEALQFFRQPLAVPRRAKHGDALSNSFVNSASIVSTPVSNVSAIPRRDAESLKPRAQFGRWQVSDKQVALTTGPSCLGQPHTLNTATRGNRSNSMDVRGFSSRDRTATYVELAEAVAWIVEANLDQLEHAHVTSSSSDR